MKSNKMNDKNVFFSSHTVSNLLSGISFAPFNLTKKIVDKLTQKNEFLFLGKKTCFIRLLRFEPCFHRYFNDRQQNNQRPMRTIIE